MAPDGSWLADWWHWSLPFPLSTVSQFVFTLNWCLWGMPPRQGSRMFHETHSSRERPSSLTVATSYQGEDCPRPGPHSPMQFMLRSPLNTPLGTLRMRLSWMRSSTRELGRLGGISTRWFLEM